MRILTFALILFIVSSCGKTEEQVKLEYLKKGEEITNQAQAELLKNVSVAMKKGGPVYAIEFCNIRALPLLDSLSTNNNCEIRRISLKYRNPADKPQDNLEEEQLNLYQGALYQGAPLEPKVFLSEDRIEYFKPILLGMDACLNCHGSPGTHIAEETLTKIKELYPEDLATGFALNEFRGAWKVTFAK
jgi:hypothetical protein